MTPAEMIETSAHLEVCLDTNCVCIRCFAANIGVELEKALGAYETMYVHFKKRTEENAALRKRVDELEKK